MYEKYKNSYKVTEKELVSLSVYNVDFNDVIPCISGDRESGIII